MGAEQDLRKAQASIARQEGIIRQQEANLARAKASGRPTATFVRVIASLKSNISVFKARASTAFQEVVRQKTIQFQAKIKKQKEQAAKAEKQRQKQAQQKLVADSQAQKQRDRDAEARKKQASILKAQEVFQSEDIQQDVKPTFETGGESTLFNLEQKRLSDIERLEKTKTIPRLEEGTSFFGTGAGFEPVDIDSGKGAGASRTEGTAFKVKDGKVTEKPIKNILDPSSSEGAFIDTQIQSQLGTNVESFLQTEKVITAIKTEKGPKAAEVFEQTVTPELAEAGTRGGSTFLISAEEAGLAINRPKEGFPAISGNLIGETIAPGDFADIVNADFVPGGTAFKVKKGKVTSQPIEPIDKFALAKSEIELTGLVAGEPISFGNLLGFDTPPKKKSTPITSQIFPPSFGSGGLGPLNQPRKPQNTVKSIIDAGFAPTQRPIERGIIPFDQPISSLGKVGKKPPRNIPLLIGGVRTTPSILGNLEDNFGSFVTSLGSDFGFDIGGDFFKSISSNISFGRSTSTEKIRKKKKVSAKSVEFAKKIAIAKKTPNVSFDVKTGKFISGSPSGVGFVTGKTFAEFNKNKNVAIQQKRKQEAVKKEKFNRNLKIKQQKEAKRKIASQKRRTIKAKQKSAKFKGQSKSTKRKTTKVKVGAGGRSSDRSQDFLSGIGTSPGTKRARGPSSSGGIFNIPTVSLGSLSGGTKAVTGGKRSRSSFF